MCRLASSVANKQKDLSFSSTAKSIWLRGRRKGARRLPRRALSIPDSQPTGNLTSGVGRRTTTWLSVAARHHVCHGLPWREKKRQAGDEGKTAVEGGHSVQR